MPRVAKVVRVDLHRPEIDRLLREPEGPLWRRVEEYAKDVEDLAKAYAPKDSGKGAESIKHEVKRLGRKKVRARIGTGIKYMYWQHQGTGVYAGRGPIFPKKKKALAFWPKPNSPHVRPPMYDKHGRPQGKVVVRSVKGVKPQPFLLDALKHGQPWPVTRNATTSTAE